MSNIRRQYMGTSSMNDSSTWNNRNWNMWQETDDNIMMLGDDDEKQLYMNKKELVHWENDESISINSSYEDDHTLNNNTTKQDKYIFRDITPKQIVDNTNQIINTNNIIKTKKPNQDLMKFIDGDEEEEDDYYDQEILMSNNNNNNKNNNNNNNNNVQSSLNSLVNKNPNVPNNNMIQQMEANINSNYIYKPWYSSTNSGTNLGLIHNKQFVGGSELYCINNFRYCVIGKGNSHRNNNPSVESLNQISFGWTQSKELESKYKEMEKSYNEVLNLLQYWQKFYLDIVELVSTNIGDDKSVDYFSKNFVSSVIEDVNNLIKKADTAEAPRLWWPTHEIHFNFWQYQKDTEILIIDRKSFTINKINLLPQERYESKVREVPCKNMIVNEESFTMFTDITSKSIHTKNELIINYKKNDLRYYNSQEEINNLPPMIYKEKISEGMNTDFTGDFNCNSEIMDNTNKWNEYLNVVKNKFEIWGSVVKGKDIKANTKKVVWGFKREIFFTVISRISTGDKSKEVKKNKNKNNQIISNGNDSAKNVTQICNQYKQEKEIRLEIKQNPKKKIISSKPKTAVQETQTLLLGKNIESIEFLNNEYCKQLEYIQKDKEKMEKFYEDKIKFLNEELDKTKGMKDWNITTTSIVDPYGMFLPEMIPPEQTYKIFLHCIKHFKYEEDLYKKFMEEADWHCLKAFINKIERYMNKTSVPLQRNHALTVQKVSHTNKEHSSRVQVKQNNLFKKDPFSELYEEMYQPKQIPNDYSNIKERNSNANNMNNNKNTTFNKYKAVLKSLKNK